MGAKFKTLQELIDWQELVRKPKKPFLFADAKIFWSELKDYFPLRVFRDGVAEFSEITLEVAPGFGLQIKAPSAKTRVLVSVVPLNFDEKANWEESITEEQEKAKYERKPRQPKEETLDIEQSDIDPDAEGDEAHLGEDDLDSEDGGYDVDADDEGGGFGGGHKHGSGGGGEEEDDPFGKGGGEDEEDELGDDQPKDKKKRKKSVSASRYLDSVPELKELPKAIKDTISVWYGQMGTDEYIEKQLEKTEFRIMDEQSFDFMGTSCLLLPLYNVKEDFKEYLGFIGSLNLNQVANKRTEFGNKNRAEAVLVSKADPAKTAYAVLYAEGYKNLVSVIRF